MMMCSSDAAVRPQLCTAEQRRWARAGSLRLPARVRAMLWEVQKDKSEPWLWPTCEQAYLWPEVPCRG